MNSREIIAAVASSLGVLTFAAIFTVLYHIYTQASIKELKTGKRDIELMDGYIHESLPSVKTRRRVFATVRSVCFYAVLAILIPLFIFSLFNKAKGNVTMIGDKTVMVVATGSMSKKNPVNEYLTENGLDDQFDAFSMIVLEKVEREELGLYDVIAFRDREGKNIIHRIIKVNGSGETVSYETRGDANDTDDSYDPRYSDVIGRYTGESVPIIGAFILFFQSVGGMVTLISLIYCIVMLDRYNEKLREVEKARLDQLLSAIELEPDHNADDVRAEFVETLYYKGYVYLFNDSGFVSKKEIDDESYLERSNSSAIRITNADGVKTEKEILIESEERDE
jgi:signal peptidase